MSDDFTFELEEKVPNKELKIEKQGDWQVIKNNSDRPITAEEFEALINKDYKKAKDKVLIKPKKDKQLPSPKDTKNKDEEKIEEKDPPKKCSFIMKDGQQCSNWVIPGSDYCSKHTNPVPSKPSDFKPKVIPKGKVKEGLYSTTKYTASVQGMVSEYRKDPDLENLDIELAYMKSLKDRVENLEIPEFDKVKLVGDILIETTKMAERRQKIIEARKYYLEVSQITYFVTQILNIINRHVQSPEERLAIKEDIQGLYIKRLKK